MRCPRWISRVGGVYWRMDALWHDPWVVRHSEILCLSYRRLTGRDLIHGTLTPVDRARQLYEAPIVLVSHGMEPDPILNYGNAAALDLWEMSWDELRRTPSRLTAEAPERSERARLLEAVTLRGFIDDYTGVRISRTGRRFRIVQATVWNLVDPHGTLCGQAATFSRWEPMPPAAAG